MHLEASELAISATGEQSGSYKAPKITLGRVDQSPTFVDRQISNARRVSLLERLDAAPGIVRGDLALAPGAVERRFDDR